MGKGPWGAEAWHHSPVRDEYYYGVFWSGMPDLNYETPAVQQEAMKIATFWLREMGADGFRLDAVPYLLEEGSCLAGCPGTHAFLRAYAAHIRGLKPDAYTVGEVWGSIDQTLPYYPDQLTSYFGFELADSLLSVVRTGKASTRRCRTTPTSLRRTSALSWPIHCSPSCAPGKRPASFPDSSGCRAPCLRTDGRRSCQTTTRPAP
ncbi:MAG: hypothetical protein DMD67_07540 [Gemmatimonadetes bacterium]|nr:MAG: hypothetical protein DMD67_07540 [Gemmatimonadota bacterium]